MLALVSEDGAVDALLSSACPLIDAVVNESSPDETGITGFCAQDELVTGADKQLARPPVRVVVAAVMPFVKCEAIKVAILSHPP